MAPIHVHLQMGPFQELEAESGNAEGELCSESDAPQNLRDSR